MTNFVTGASARKNRQPPASALRIQNSVSGQPRAIGWGQARLAGNLIWYGDFQAVPQQSGGGKGGGGKGGGGGGGKGGGGGATSYNYQAAVAIGLCEGPVAAVLQAWSNKTAQSLASLNLTAFDGASDQQAWGYLTSLHPTQAIDYRGLAYVAAAPMQMGSSPELPNLSYEVLFGINSAIPGLPDADPAAVVADLLTNPQYGLGFPSARLGDLSGYSAWCRAMGLVVSPVISSQAAANSFLADLMTATNSEMVWAGGKLTIVPYGDTAVTSNGATWSPPAAPLYSLTDDDFLAPQGSSAASASATSSPDPVTLTRKRPADQINDIKIEYLDRNNAYNPTIAEASAAAAIETFGLKAGSTKQLHMVCDGSAAQASVQLQLGRQMVRNLYTFTVDRSFILLDPMDVIAISDPGLGLVEQWVRITEITENSDYALTIAAEEYLEGTGAAPTYGHQANAGAIPNYNAAAPNVNAPVIFEPPDALAGGLEVWIGASGSGGNRNWAGAQVWLSQDGQTYSLVGTIDQPARQGVLTAPLPAVAPAALGPTIDSTDTLAVDLSTSGGSLVSVSQTDMLSANSLCWVDDGAGGELLGFQTATLTGADTYNLATLLRGAYGDTPTTHNAGAQFVRVDGAMVQVPFSADRIGQTVYVKLLSYNAWGGGLQLLSDVPAYTYVLKGRALASPLPDVVNLVPVYRDGRTVLVWDAVTDFRAPVDYEVRKGPDWAVAEVLGRTPSPEFVAQGDGDYWIAAHYLVPGGGAVYSATAAGLAIAGSVLTTNVVATFDEAATGWSGTLTQAAVDGSGNLVLVGAGAFSAVSDVSALSSVFYLGDIVTSGTYEVPAGHVVDLGQPVPCTLSASYTMLSENPMSPISRVPQFSALPSVEGNYAGLSDVRVQVALAGADGVFGAWADLVPGTYVARMVKMRLALTSSDPTVTALISSFAWTVDMPDVTDTGTDVAVPAAGLAVTFGQHFQVAPNVQVQVLGAEAGDDVVISNKTASGFTVQVLNGGVGVARTVDWVAQGY